MSTGSTPNRRLSTELDLRRLSLASSSPQNRRLSNEPTASPGSPASQSPPTKISLANRPAFCSIGSEFNTLVNYFEIQAQGVPDLWQFSFQIQSRDRTDSQISQRYKRRIIFLVLDQVDDFTTAASDYASIFISTKPLTANETATRTIEIDYFEAEESGPRSGQQQLKFRVSLRYVQVFRTQNLLNHLQNQYNSYPKLQEHITALDIILGRGPAQNPRMTQTARNQKFFNIANHNGRRDLGLGLDVYKGYFKSAKLTKNGLVLNLNVAASAMYKTCRLSELIKLMLQGAESRDMEAQLHYLDSQLRLLQVITTYTGRPVKRIINKMARGERPGQPPIAAIVFFSMNSQRTSVDTHFRTAYPNVSRLDTKAYVVNVGGPQRAVYIPSDLVFVPAGQPYRKLLPKTIQTTNMINFACRWPKANMTLILNEGLPQMGIGAPGGPQDRFKLQVQPTMMKTAGRLLPPPLLVFGASLTAKVEAGAWNIQQKTFKVPAPKTKMNISYFELLTSNMSSAQNLAAWSQSIESSIRAHTGHKDVRIRNFSTEFNHSRVLPQDYNRHHQSKVWKYLPSKDIRMVLVILPNKSPQLYREVKTSADCLGDGIHTVCLVRKTDGSIRTHPSECANEVLKINTKLGGVNWAWQMPKELKALQDKKIMFIGADVVHPGQTAMKAAPSVAAVTASLDSNFFQYPGCYRLQQPADGSKKAVEFIQNFDSMSEERLLLYRKTNNALPDLIIVIRDGVADNMFEEVLNSELRQLQLACRKQYPKGSMPQIIFMVCQKRGHTRFYQPPGSNSEAFDNNGNPMPGFLVDNHIVSGTAYDWFLVSHKCIKGTSRPAHYTVLYNNADLDVNTLQQLIYATCYLWPRATRSIGIHTAARAADAMCDRAKVYLHDVYFLPPELQGENKPTYQARNHWSGGIAPNLRNTMFYI